MNTADQRRLGRVVFDLVLDLLADALDGRSMAIVRDAVRDGVNIDQVGIAVERELTAAGFEVRPL